MDDLVDGEDQKPCDAHADQTRAKADDKGLGVEDLGDVALAGTDGPEHADLLGPLHDGDIGDNADHDGGDDQGNGHEGDQNIADRVDDCLDGGHHDARQGRVADDLVLLALGFHVIVVPVQEVQENLLACEIHEVDGDSGGVLQIRVA